jgi:hypothetical protein
MKLILASVVLLAISTIAVAAPGEDNQSIPPIVVPEVLHTNSVGATLTSNSSDYGYGQPVHLAFTVTNHSKSTVNYEFTSGQMYDVVISDGTGKAIWHWSKSKVFGQLVTHLSLAPNASSNCNVVWNQRDDDDHPVPGGEYSVLAEMLPMDRPEVTGNLIANPNNDPVNTGMPTVGPVESGAVNVKNTTPELYAKTTFKVESGS